MAICRAIADAHMRDRDETNLADGWTIVWQPLPRMSTERGQNLQTMLWMSGHKRFGANGAALNISVVTSTGRRLNTPRDA